MIGAVMVGATGYHPLVERAWAAWEALRRCGFAAKDIFVDCGPTIDKDGRAVDDGVNVALRTQGKQFVVTCGRLGGNRDASLDLPYEEFHRQWVEFCSKVNAGNPGPSDVMHQILMRALGTWGGAVSLVLAIQKKGIRVTWPAGGESSAWGAN